MVFDCKYEGHSKQKTVLQCQHRKTELHLCKIECRCLAYRSLNGGALIRESDTFLNSPNSTVLGVVSRGCQCFFYAQGYNRPALGPFYSRPHLARSLYRVVLCYTVTLLQNSETTKTFVKLIFDDWKREFEEIFNENNELLTENKELQNSIEFCHNQTIDLKSRDGIIHLSQPIPIPILIPNF